MALVRCGECGNAVSTAATTCPKCGAPVVVAAAATGTVATPFWIPSRIVGAVLCALGGMALLFAIIHFNSFESQLKRQFKQEDWPLWIALGLAAELLLIGVPLFAGVMRFLNTTGQVIFVALLLSIPLFVVTFKPGVVPSLLLVWVPFVIPRLKAGYAKATAVGPAGGA